MSNGPGNAYEKYVDLLTRGVTLAIVDLLVQKNVATVDECRLVFERYGRMLHASDEPGFVLHQSVGAWLREISETISRHGMSRAELLRSTFRVLPRPDGDDPGARES